jgi:DNA-binding beta-propeller fold protein YncE
VALGADGAYYVADKQNNRIRRIADGQVTTYAGTGEAGKQDGARLAATFDRPTGLAVDAQGALYVCDSGNSLIRKIAPDGTVTTLPIQGLNTPLDVAILPDGRLAIADAGNRQVKVVSTTP